MDPLLKILVVDDMPAMRSIVRGMLQEIGLKQVIEAEDGESAWQLIRQGITDPKEAIGLVISDWNMPGMTGVDLLRTLRTYTHTRDLPFFMVTAEGDQAHLSGAVNAGVTDYLVKPFNAEQLRDQIDKAFMS